MKRGDDEVLGPEGACSTCDQTLGAMRYSEGFKKINCFRCHMMYCVMTFDLEASHKYFESLKSGVRYPAITDTTDWSVLERDHGFKWPGGKATTELEVIEGGRQKTEPRSSI